uniref:Uncharacterized protein n=1 Tax=Roseihalotalea indica TaxID=2867963 RepID=A0AA49PZK1_9BACT|nr:hypothetical protein K4G66_13985 [Tunicatimonas sp. TK19036]
MKRLLTISLAVLFCMIAQSCQEDEIIRDLDREFPENAEIISLAPGEAYFYKFQAIPFEGGFSIEEAPLWAEISEFNIQDGKLGYLYKPEKSFVGNDWVELAMCVSVGGPECNNVPFVTLGFKVGP